jgi:YesN/AraC family two-component response regulator
MDKLPDYSEKRFLIVDDEPFMLSLVDRMLKQCKAGLILKATDGGSAMRAVKDNFTQVDCIISDCNMKPLNGLQLLQGVRIGVNPRIPRDQAFIMLTGHGETEVVKSAIALDVNGYVVKPVALDKLIQTVEKALKRPIDVKDAEVYRAVKLPKVQSAFGDTLETKKTPWVVMPKGGPFKNPDAVKQKIELFKREHANQDGVVEEVKIKNKRECSIDELVEGHVIAQDVEAEEGVVLIRRGTYLTRDMIARLQDIAAETNPKEMVWVGELAKA